LFASRHSHNVALARQSSLDVKSMHVIEAFRGRIRVFFHDVK
jgi:hypothetical protein